MNPLTSGAANSGSTILSSLGNNSSLISSIQNQLSTNKKILDPAQQGVVTRLNSQVTSYAAATNNIAKAQNVLNVSATGLSSISSLLTQMQDLANKANDATMTTADAAKLNQTFQSLLKQVTTTATKSIIDSVGLLGPNSVALEIQTGLTASETTRIAGVNSTAKDLIGTGNIASKASVASVASVASAASASALGTSPSVSAVAAVESVASAASVAAGGVAGELDISSTANATAAIAALKSALDTVSTNQSSVAADQLALKTVNGTNSSISLNLQNTIDTIEKPDAAKLQMDLQNANNQQSMNYYLINQMNQQAQSVLTIFR